MSKDGEDPPTNSPLTSVNDEMSDDERKQKVIDLKNEGNQFFKDANFEKAIHSYLNSLEMCPKEDSQTQVILNSNLAAAKDHLKLYEEAIDFCNKALELNESHSKALLRRAKLFKKTDKLDESLADFKRYMELNPNDKNVPHIIEELTVKINERNEKIKTEMLSKLKDLGNVVLKPFGLSTDNFKVKKNSETGGYSIDFQK